MKPLKTEKDFPEKKTRLKGSCNAKAYKKAPSSYSSLETCLIYKVSIYLTKLASLYTKEFQYMSAESHNFTFTFPSSVFTGTLKQTNKIQFLIRICGVCMDKCCFIKKDLFRVLLKFLPVCFLAAVNSPFIFPSGMGEDAPYSSPLLGKEGSNTLSSDRYEDKDGKSSAR